jgi:hypothetical protein
MRRLIVIFFCSLASKLGAQTDSLQNRTLAATEMREDLAYYRRLLQETHPGLYRYTSREKMQAKLDSIEQSLNKPLPFYEFYGVITALAADIRCAHTNALPTANFRRHLNAIKALPFFVYPVQGKLYVIFNGSTDQTIKLGDELVSINGRQADSIAQVLKRHYWADGYSELPKNAVLQGGLFCYFYYALIDQPEQFDLQFRDPQGTEHRVTVAAQPYSFSEKQFIKSPVNARAVSLYNKNVKTPWRLSFPEDVPSTAFLRFDGFGGKGINSSDDARAAMRKFMNESMKKIEKKKRQNLIIDVRDNPGGWDAQGVELYTYVVKGDAPVHYYKRAHAVTNDSEFLKYSDLSEEDQKNVNLELRSESDGTFSLIEEKSPELQPQNPKPNRFKGRVYILVNERTASAAAEFVALCKSNKVGVLIGEEAGGAYEGGNGASFIHLELPHSKIQVGTPLLFYDNAVIPVQPIGRGAIPDHTISMQSEDLLTGYNRQLEFVKELIRK